MYKIELPSVDAMLTIGGFTLLDQVTKYLIWTSFAVGESRSVINGFFSITYVRNIGAAWGIMAGWRAFLALLAVAMLGFITIKRNDIFGKGRLAWWSFVLLFSGIIGNFLDRVRLGYVVDFLDFFHGSWHFPAFNVADSAICAGVGIYMICHFFGTTTGKDDITGSGKIG